MDVKPGGEIEIRFLNAETRAQGVERIRTEYSGAFAYREADRDGAAFVSLLLAEGEQANIEDYAVSQNLTTLRNRVNELGVSEPLVQRQGRNRIVVELPGVQDTATAKRVWVRQRTLSSDSKRSLIRQFARHNNSSSARMIGSLNLSAISSQRVIL